MPTKQVLPNPARGGIRGAANVVRTVSSMPNEGFYFPDTWGTEDGNEFGTEASDTFQVED